MFNVEMTVIGAGYGGFSGGELVIKVNWNEYVYVFNAPCQSTSGAGMGFGPFKVSNDVAGKSEMMLTDLQHYIVQVDIPTSFIGWGKIDLTFQVFTNDSSDPIFKVNRKVDAVGCSLGGVSILTTPKLLRKGLKNSNAMVGADMQDAFGGFM